MIKRKISLILTILISALTYGQIEKIETTNGVTTETFSININGLKQGEYKLKYKNRIQIKGTYSDDLKNGKWIYQPDEYFKLEGHYKSDEKDSIWNCYFNDIKYSTHNYITGERRSYYRSGKLRTHGDSVNGEYHFIEYSKSGKIIKQVRSDSVFTVRKEFDEKGNLIEHIILTDSKPNGKYEKFNELGDCLVSGQYQKGGMVNDWVKYASKIFEEDTEITYSVSDSVENDADNKIGIRTGEVFFIVEDMPVFNGESYNEFRNFIWDNLQYPKEATEMRIQGRVYVKFSIDWNGKVVDAKIVRGVNPLLDNEALRVVNSSPYWRPGMQRGVPVKVQLVFPISFKLSCQ